MSDTSPMSMPAADEAPRPDPLTHCATAVASISAGAATIASLTADLVARSDEALLLALKLVNSTRCSLLARKTRVLASAMGLSRKQGKWFDATLDEADVTMKQLRVWAAVAGGACPVALDVVAFSLLFASLSSAQGRVVGVGGNPGLTFAGAARGSVATGDGLYVVSAAGPGLKWFEPHFRNEFSVVLAHADGSVPEWLTTSDVAADVQSSAADAPAGTATMSLTVTEHGAVSVVYEGLHDDTPEAVLQLSVCGVAVVATGAGDGEWCMRVPRRPLKGHACAALGTHVRTLSVVKGSLGMAVSADEKWLVVGLKDVCTLSVYFLPGGELVRTFGSKGNAPLQFDGLSRLCFAPNGNLLVADAGNERVQEVTLEGMFIRFIGVGEFGGGYPSCVTTVHDAVIVVGCQGYMSAPAVLFDSDTGAVTDRKHWLEHCGAIHFTRDGGHVIIAEGLGPEPERLSVHVFPTSDVGTAAYGRVLGEGVLQGQLEDVLQSSTGEYIVTDCGNHRVCVFSPGSLELVRSWGVKGTGDGQFELPSTLAAAGRHLYVMDYKGGRVQVFE